MLLNFNERKSIRGAFGKALVEVGKNHQVIYDGPGTKIPNNIRDLTIREWLLEYDDKLKEYVLYTQVY